MRINMISLISMCIISILPSNNALPFHHNYCKSDSDCHQPNFYCYESRECVECTKCSFYNRQINPAIKCAKNKDECGDCTLGMEAALNFDGTFTCNPTLPIPPTIPINNNQNPVNNESNNNLGLYVSIPLCILAFISCLALIVRFKLCSYIKKIIPSSNCSNNNINNRGAPPPPYSEKNPSAPPEENPLITNQRILHEDNQRANMFHPPNWVSGGTYIDPYPPENQPETPASPVAVADDENTQPSPWSPNSNDLSNSNEPTSFSNILSTTPPIVSTPPDQPPNRSNTNNSDNQENTESSRSNPSLLIQVNISNNNIMNTAQVINEI